MAPLILHNVPDEELYIGEDGIQRPYAMIYPQYVSLSLYRFMLVHPLTSFHYPDKMATRATATFETDAQSPRQAPLASRRDARDPKPPPPPAAKIPPYNPPTRFLPPTSSNRAPNPRTPPTTLPLPSSDGNQPPNPYPVRPQKTPPRRPTRSPPPATFPTSRPRSSSGVSRTSTSNTPP